MCKEEGSELYEMGEPVQVSEEGGDVVSIEDLGCGSWSGCDVSELGFLQ